MATTKIAIAGITGKMGQLILKALLAKPSVQIHAIARNPSKLDEALKSNSRVHIFEAASDDAAALRKGVAGTSACICCYLGDNTLMVEGQKTLIDACIAEKVPRYIASDWSLDFRGLKLGDHPAKDPMKHITQYLEEKEKEGLIVGVHVLNGVFMEVFWAPFVGFVNVAEDKFTAYGTGDEPIEMTTYEDAANFTAEVALDNNATGFLNVLGDRKSIKEIAQVYKNVYGTEPTIASRGSLDELYKTMIPVFKENPQNPFKWMGMFYQYYMLNGSTLLTSVDNERYPELKAKNIEKFLKDTPKEKMGKPSY